MGSIQFNIRRTFFIPNKTRYLVLSLAIYFSHQYSMLSNVSNVHHQRRRLLTHTFLLKRLKTNISLVINVKTHLPVNAVGSMLYYSTHMMTYLGAFLNGVAVDDGVLLQNRKFHLIFSILISKCSARSKKTSTHTLCF